MNYITEANISSGNHKKYAAFLIVLGFVALGFLYMQPIYFNFPIYYDSGVFAYVGSIINHGGLPNVDAFDHKGIWIYLINSYGLRLFNGEFRGIYVVELFLIISALIFSLVIISKATQKNMLGLAIAFVALIASYGILFEGGNLPETIMFPWQIIFYSFAAYVLTLDQPNRWQIILLVIFALLAIYAGIFTRPNNAIGTIILSIILCFNLKRTFFILLIMFGLIVGSSIAYLINRLGLSQDMFNQYIQYNLYYSSINPPTHRIFNTLSLLLMVGLLPLGIFVSFTVSKILTIWHDFLRLSVLASQLKRCNSTFLSNVIIKLRNRNILYIFFVITVFDIVSQLVSGRFGRGYLHYAIIILPGLFIYSIFLQDFLLKSELFKFKQVELNKIIIVIVVLLFGSILYFNQFAYSNYYKDSAAVNRLANDIKNNTSEGDRIYVSYADAWIYVITKHRSFSKYFYPNAVLQVEFDGKDRVAEMLNEYQKSPPSLLVVWKSLSSPSFEQSFAIEKIRERLVADYHLKINETNYSIYIRNE